MPINISVWGTSRQNLTVRVHPAWASFVEERSTTAYVASQIQLQLPLGLLLLYPILPPHHRCFHQIVIVRLPSDHLIPASSVSAWPVGTPAQIPRHMWHMCTKASCLTTPIIQILWLRKSWRNTQLMISPIISVSFRFFQMGNFWFQSVPMCFMPSTILLISTSLCGDVRNKRAWKTVRKVADDWKNYHCSSTFFF